MQINPSDVLDKQVLVNLGVGQIQQVGIDLTIKETVVIPHSRAFNVDLEQIVNLPNDMFALFYGRSSFNRRGILIRGSVYDPGYKGVCGCTIYNMSGETLTIQKQERVGQMLFFKASSAAEYNGQFQNEKL